MSFHESLQSLLNLWTLEGSHAHRGLCAGCALDWGLCAVVKNGCARGCAWVVRRLSSRISLQDGAESLLMLTIPYHSILIHSSFITIPNCSLLFLIPSYFFLLRTGGLRGFQVGACHWVVRRVVRRVVCTSKSCTTCTRVVRIFC